MACWTKVSVPHKLLAGIGAHSSAMAASLEDTYEIQLASEQAKKKLGENASKTKVSLL